MKSVCRFLLLSLISISGALAEGHLYAPAVSPKEAWDHIARTPYTTLPHTTVSVRDFVSRAGENLLVKDSKRTVELEHQFIPPQRKLIFPNGICLRGEWKIDSHNLGHTGYFRPGAKAIVIGRAAVSLSKVNYKDLRTLAISGKVFPTKDKFDSTPLKPANFLLMNDNAGKKRTYLTEAYLTNAAPRTVSFASLFLVRIALKVAQAFDKADVRRDVRQLYQIAELTATPPYSSPKWMILKSTPEYEKLSHTLKAQDFRDEVKAIIDSNKKLEFEIRVASDLNRGQPVYQKIGTVSFTEYAASATCDESLHFQHPPYREEYALPVVDQKH
jgi:hypothetical protein